MPSAVSPAMNSRRERPPLRSCSIIVWIEAPLSVASPICVPFLPRSLSAGELCAGAQVEPPQRATAHLGCDAALASHLEPAKIQNIERAIRPELHINRARERRAHQLVQAPIAHVNAGDRASGTLA